MSASPNPLLGKVSQSSTRYAHATTTLSQTIVEVEAFLNTLPGKREVSITRSGEATEDGLSFTRAGGGTWQINYVPPPLAQLVLIASTRRGNGTAPLRDLPVEMKLKAAPLLAPLIQKLADELCAEALRAENAVAAVRAALEPLRKGGA
ncbi:MAG: hypothetical protein ACKVU4_03715 [Phycisphaerales bacterium]